MNNETWIKRWAGSYTFISCTYWGKQYYNSLRNVYGRGLNKTLFIHKKGTVSFFIRENELQEFGHFLADIVRDQPSKVEQMLTILKKKTDDLLVVMNELQDDIPSSEEYQKFLEIFDNYLGHYVFMKKTVDFLEHDLLEKYFPLFKDARMYSELVYSKSETFFRGLVKLIGEKENVDHNLLTCLMKEELEEYIAHGVLPDIRILQQRFDASLLTYEDGELHIIYGEDALEMENRIAHQDDQTVLKGVVAYPGKVIGKCKIIFDPFEQRDFVEGEILVTGMTRPEFVPYMGKAAAIVTDAGGMLCHAAITSREMKKPCIVATERATKFLKDGDLVEVDADNGIVRKL